MNEIGKNGISGAGVGTYLTIAVKGYGIARAACSPPDGVALRIGQHHFLDAIFV